eukprot:TRINITY_DN4161_c0_g1_i1.p1 TRINITY_DN4161_c0_g1~~TRINITY_DN4161_c0_g1_i1.p1  ORF type:complete len:246 (-),score=25.66 TRINITY_DN4161_c0_g1_i1:137-874(-)
MMTKDTKRSRETEGIQKGDYASMTHHWKLHRPNPRKKKCADQVNERSPPQDIQQRDQAPFMDNIKLVTQWQANLAPSPIPIMNEQIVGRIPLPIIRTDLYNPNYRCEDYPMERMKRIRRPAVVEAMLPPDSFPKLDLNIEVPEVSPPNNSSPYVDDSSAPVSPEESSSSPYGDHTSFESVQEHQFEAPMGHPSHHRSSLELFAAHADSIADMYPPSHRDSVDYAFWDHMIDLRRGSFENSRDVLV